MLILQSVRHRLLNHHLGRQVGRIQAEAFAVPKQYLKAAGCRIPPRKKEDITFMSPMLVHGVSCRYPRSLYFDN